MTSLVSSARRIFLHIPFARISSLPVSTRSVLVRFLVFICAYVTTSWAFLAFNNSYHDLNIKLDSNPYVSFLLYPFVAIFLFLRWKNIQNVAPIRQSRTQTFLFLGLALLMYAIPADFILVYLSKGWIFSYYIPLFAGHVALFFAVFGTAFASRFGDDLLLFLFMFITLLVGATLIEGYWGIFSGIIVRAVQFILSYVAPAAQVTPETFHISLRNFQVFIGAPCAGVYSMTVFSLLYLVTLHFFSSNGYKLSAWKAAAAMFAGIVAMFLFNILRIAIIVLVGGYVSASLAMNLFHEYLQAIFLLTVFMFYVYWLLPRIVVKERKS